MGPKRFITWLLIALVTRHAQGYMRVCYYTNWSQFASNYQALPGRALPQLCTHVIFAFADIRANNVTPIEFNDVDMYARLNRLKQISPSFQIILAIGGWAAGGGKFSRLVSSQASMNQFTANLINYVRRYGLDGVNIDWEYPTATDRGSDVIDRERYTRFLQTIQRGFLSESASSGRPRLTLSAALETDIRDARTYYQIDEIGKILDFACLMAYDMHGQWDSRLGAQHHSPLNPEIATNVLGWTQAGFPAEKLLLGVAGFGRSFTLAAEPTGSGLGQRVTGGGAPGSFSGEPGLLDYGEICQYIVRDGWTRVWLQDMGGPVAFGNTSTGWQWVGYDDPESMVAKAVFIRQNGLAGVMFWSLEHDDFSNLCNNGTWPLLRTLFKELPNNSSLAPYTPTTTATTQPNATTATTLRATTPGSNTTVTEQDRSTTSGTLPRTSQPATSTNTATTTVVVKPVLDVPGREDVVVGWPATQRPETTSTHTRAQSRRQDVQSYRQCKMADLYGPSLTCPPSRGKPGDRRSFYFYCFPGYFAIECRCLPGNFFNRCLQTCDLEENFKTCPFVH